MNKFVSKVLILSGVIFLLFGIVSFSCLDDILLNEEYLVLIIMSIAFTLVGVVLLYNGIKGLFKYKLAFKYGTTYTGVIVEYKDNYNFQTNGIPELVLVIKIVDNFGKEFLIDVNTEEFRTNKFPIGASCVVYEYDSTYYLDKKSIER